MIREDLVSSAVSFLRDPSVANAPVQKKISFLQSKNLTKEEVDVALQRVGDTAVGPSQGPSAQYAPQQQYYPPSQGYGPYGPGGYWAQQNYETQGRDWRDWFIMATVLGGVGYGLYATAKRYLVPLVKPPTPPQLEQDKAKIDEEFNKAFALLDQLASDTAALKESEESRTEKLDKALEEVEQVMKELRHQDRTRQETIRQTTQTVTELRDAIPDAVTAQLKMHVKPLEDELKSLRTLVDRRLSSATPTNTSSAPARPAPVPPTSVIASPEISAPSSPFGANPPTATVSTPSSLAPRATKASIPAWQKAAAQRAASVNSTPTDKPGSPAPPATSSTSS